MTDPCYREPTNGVYFTRNAHRNDCADADCRGCRPCAEKRHCTASRNCSWHVAEGELTCGRCLAKVRFDLRWIGDLSMLLLPAAIMSGLRSEAANLDGPAADAEAWTWHKVAQARAGTPWEAIEDDDEHHPARVTGTWARMVSEDYDHDMPPLATTAWCVKYLDRNLHRIANDNEQDFPLLAAELKKCRQHLEAVLRNDTRPDRGAPCPTCVAAIQRLRDELVASDVPENEWPKLTKPRLRREYAHWCDDETCERMHFTDDSDDVWRCPHNPAHWWTQQGYADLLEERKTRESA